MPRQPTIVLLASLDRTADDLRARRQDPELTQIAADTRPFATENRLTACLPDVN